MQVYNVKKGLLRIKMKKILIFTLATCFLSASYGRDMSVDDNCQMDHRYLSILYKKTIKIQPLEKNSFKATHALEQDQISVLFNYAQYCKVVWENWKGCHKHYDKYDLGHSSGLTKLNGYVAFSSWHWVKKGGEIDVHTCVGHPLELNLYE